MRDRALLAGYLAAVVTATLVHDPRLLGAGAALVLLSAGRGLPRLLGRVVRAALPFVLAVSLGYLLMARHEPAAAGTVLLRLDLRVLLLVGLAFRVLPAVNLQRALGFSATLRFLLVLATSQVLTFRRLFGDFRDALAVRTPHRPDLPTALRHGAATAAWFARRAEHDATQMTQALDARGFFLDRD
ncbi:MAG: ABC transporter permease [Candidatus Krumholzibacteriia bacterium]